VGRVQNAAAPARHGFSRSRPSWFPYTASSFRTSLLVLDFNYEFLPRQPPTRLTTDSHSLTANKQSVEKR